MAEPKLIPKTVFHLPPGECLGGEKLAVKCEALERPAQVVGQLCTVELRLAGARDPTQLAKLAVKIQRRSDGSYFLSDVKREDVAPRLPEVVRRPIPDLSKKPSRFFYTRNPRWLPPHFYLKLDDGSEHLVVIPADQNGIRPVGIAANPYCYRVELVVSKGGQRLFSSAAGLVDCANLLAHDCAEWAECMREDHNERLQKFRQGTHFVHRSEPIEMLHRKGLEQASCVGYLLAATSRGHKEFGLRSVWEAARESYLAGGAGIIPKSGVGLVKGLVDKAKWTALLWMVVTDKNVVGRITRGQLLTLRTRLIRNRVCFGMPIAEIIIKTENDPAASAIKKLPHGLTCFYGGSNAFLGYHTGLIVRGSLCDVNMMCSDQEPNLFSKQPKIEKWKPMLVCTPPGLWPRLRARK